MIIAVMVVAMVAIIAIILMATAQSPKVAPVIIINDEDRNACRVSS